MTRAGRIVLVGAALASVTAGAAGNESWSALRPVLEAELESGRIDDPQDLYKFLFQSVMGPGHAVPDAAFAQRWLDGEWEELDTGTMDAAGIGSVTTALRADGRLVRVHLQASYDSVRVGSEPEAADDAIARLRRDILESFVATANAWTGDRDHLQRLWLQVRDDEELWREHFSADACREFTAAIAEAGWPAVHHSDAYGERWRPHYRVVAAKRWAVAAGEKGTAATKRH